MYGSAILSEAMVENLASLGLRFILPSDRDANLYQWHLDPDAMCVTDWGAIGTLTNMPQIDNFRLWSNQELLTEILPNWRQTRPRGGSMSTTIVPVLTAMGDVVEACGYDRAVTGDALALKVHLMQERYYDWTSFKDCLALVNLAHTLGVSGRAAMAYLNDNPSASLVSLARLLAYRAQHPTVPFNLLTELYQSV